MNTTLKLNDTDSIVFKAITPREVVIQVPNFITIKSKLDSKNDIQAIKIDDYIINVGDIIHLNSPTNHGKLPFKVNYILVNNSSTYKYSLLTTKLTKTSQFLMPLLYLKNIFESRTSMLWDTNFINCYTGTREEGYMKHLYVVYRFSGSTQYTTFESKLLKHPLFNRRIDVDKYNVMYVFNIEKEHLWEYYCFKSGKYSKFTEDYKQKILKFSINPAVTPSASIANTTLYGVLYKTETRRKVLEEMVDCKLLDHEELASIPYEHEEIYNGDIEIPDNNIITDEF